MANMKEEDGEPKHVEMSTEVSTLLNSTPKEDAANANINTVPCLIPSFAEACKLVSAPYSCLVMDSYRRHVALPPMYLKKKKTGIQEELNAELLKYSESFKGVPLAYDSIRILGQHGDIYDDQGFIHLNVEASFIVFKPKMRQKLVGVINKVGYSHVGCLVHGCLNASIVKPAQITPEVWRNSGFVVGGNLEFEVFQMDADVAGVVLIRARLEKSRIQELLAPSENSENMTKDVNENGGEEDVCEKEQCNVDATEMDSSSKRSHKRKKDKKQKQKEGEDVSPASELPASDSSGYISDKASKKRKSVQSDCDDAAMPVVKKRKKNKVVLSSGGDSPQ